MRAAVALPQRAGVAPSTEPRVYPEIQALRFVAVMAVVLYGDVSEAVETLK